MPLAKPEDYPEGDASKGYCIHCAHPDGTMKNYDEVLQGMADFLVHSQGLDKNAARKIAAELMDSLPAWKNRLCN
jgi:hypothetical protein